MIVEFTSRLKKNELLRNKGKIRPKLIQKRVSLYEDITKTRRTVLRIVKDKYRSAHTRNGDIAFYKGSSLHFVRKPDDLYSHGFTLEHVKECEAAFLGTN